MRFIPVVVAVGGGVGKGLRLRRFLDAGRGPAGLRGCRSGRPLSARSRSRWGRLRNPALTDGCGRVPASAGTGLYSAVPTSPSRQAVSAHSGDDPSREPPALPWLWPSLETWPGLLFLHGRLWMRLAVGLRHISARICAAVGRSGTIAAPAARFGLMSSLVRGRLRCRGEAAAGSRCDDCYRLWIWTWGTRSFSMLRGSRSGRRIGTDRRGMTALTRRIPIGRAGCRSRHHRHRSGHTCRLVRSRRPRWPSCH